MKKLVVSLCSLVLFANINICTAGFSIVNNSGIAIQMQGSMDGVWNNIGNSVAASSSAPFTLKNAKGKDYKEFQCIAAPGCSTSLTPVTIDKATLKAKAQGTLENKKNKKNKGKHHKTKAKKDKAKAKSANTEGVVWTVTAINGALMGVLSNAANENESEE